mgnify:CR=1 FL=1|jgi:hypothetical protein
MAQVNYNDMDGLQVLWHLLTTEPFFWVILGIGFFAILLSIWVDKYFDKDVDYNPNDHRQY